MNLRDHLKDILPHLLPANPAESIKGTELIQLVKLRLQEDYSDATLRYHFSIMCGDPACPIAKVEHGQGYYLRKHIVGVNAPLSMTQARLGMMFETAPDVLDLALSRTQKFRAIYARDMESQGVYPFLFDSSFAPGAPYENMWKCPDAVVVDWQGGEITDAGLVLDHGSERMKQALGVPPFTLGSVKLKVDTGPENFREDFFQAVSNARWGHSGDLVIATPITDTHLANELRQLGAEFGLGVMSYGISLEDLDELPAYYDIPAMRAREFEALQSRFHRQRLALPRPRRPEWRLIEAVRHNNSEFQALFRWLEHGLATGVVETWQRYATAGLPSAQVGAQIITQASAKPD